MAGDTSNSRTGIFVFGILVTLGLVYWCFTLWFTPPQMGPDPVIFKTVDALYTAVRNKDLPRIEDCEKQLALSLANGTLPNPSFRVLMGIIEKTRQEQWQSATESLYHFMLAQHR